MCLAPILVSSRHSRTPACDRPRGAWRCAPCGSSTSWPCRPRPRASRARWRGAGASRPASGTRRHACPRFGSSPSATSVLSSVVASSSPKTWRASISPLTQPLGQTEHVLERRSSENTASRTSRSPASISLAIVDLFLAGEQRDAAHLLEVHADRIGRLGRAPARSPRASGLSSVHSGSVGLVGLLGERRLLDGLDLDVHLAEDVDDLVELLRRLPRRRPSRRCRGSRWRRPRRVGSRARARSRISATDFFMSRFSGRFTQRYPHARSRADGPGSLGSRTALARTI